MTRFEISAVVVLGAVLAASLRVSTPAMMARTRTHGDGRRTSRVGQVVRSELASLIREGGVYGKQRCPPGLEQMISIVDVDMSPDLRNARVKVSVIGDRKNKISAFRWLRGNVRGLRYELAQRNRHMKRVPMLTFDHVDVGAATDMMVRLDELRREREAAEARRRANGEYAGDGSEDDGGIDWEATDEEAWLGEDDEEEDWDADDELEDELEDAWERETRAEAE